MENGYIYTRVSTLIQVDGFSLDAQEEEIRAFINLMKEIGITRVSLHIEHKYAVELISSASIQTKVNRGKTPNTAPPSIR